MRPTFAGCLTNVGQFRIGPHEHRPRKLLFIIIHKYSFCIRVVNIWNSLRNEVITATSVNSFKNRSEMFWADQEVLYNYKANITGNRGIKL